MQHKLIVFDWNGTILADSIPSWKASNACLEFYGAPPISFQRHRETFCFPILHFYKINGCSVDRVLDTKGHSNNLFQTTYEALAKNARTRTGARDLLRWLKDQGYSCIILSNYLTPQIKEHLARLKLEEFFQHVDAHNCDGTTILEQTTKAKRLSDYMLKRNYKPKDTVIIGDSMEEPEIAQQLGLTSIGITDGYITTKRLRQAGPDHIVHKLGDVRGVLEQLW